MHKKIILAAGGFSKIVNTIFLWDWYDIFVYKYVSGAHSVVVTFV